MLITGCFDPSIGFGRMTSSIADKLIASGLDVKISPRMHSRQIDLSKYAGRIELPRNNRPGDICMLPLFLSGRAIGCRAMVTMWETSKLPEAFVENLNRIGSCFVPSSHNVRVFRESGFTGELLKFQLGATCAVHPMEDGPITFGTIGADHGVVERKQTYKAVLAFDQEFGQEEPARLIVKQSAACADIPTNNRNVTIIRDCLDSSEMERLMRKIHIGLFPSAMEGWGLPANELMAIGRPLILPIWGGYEDFVSTDFCEPLPFTMTKSPSHLFHGSGYRPEVSVTDIRKAMRKMYSLGLQRLGEIGNLAAIQATRFTVEKMQDAFVHAASKSASLRGFFDLQTSNGGTLENSQ